MRHLLTALLACGLLGSAFAQDDKNVEGKQDGGDEKKLIEKDGAGGVKKPAGGGGEAAIPVKDVDTNGDGMISASELKAALSKLGGAYGGEKKVFKDGGGDVKKLPLKVGGDAKKAPVKDGGEKEGEKQAPSKDGAEKTGGK